MASSTILWLALSLFVCCLSIEAKTKRNTEDTLELVHVLFRHGDRTPDRHVLYPNDPLMNETYYPVGYGQLTNAGKRKEYLLGKALRKRYGKFLGKYNIETVDARCTDYNRTKMSLQLVLASLFPPQDDLVWEKRLKWQPVPFNYWSLRDDHILGDTFKNCPRYKRLYNEFSTTQEAEKMYENLTEVIDYIAEKAGINKTSKLLAEMFFTLTTESENNLPLPDWTKSIFPQVTKDLAILEYYVATSTPEMRKLASGFLMKKIIQDTRAKIKNNLIPNTKMLLYSAHEYNLAFLLRFLGNFHPHVPPYGAYILIEIHNLKGVRHVKVFYQDYTTGKPKKLKLQQCGSACRFDKFAFIYEKSLPQDDADCL